MSQIHASGGIQSRGETVDICPEWAEILDIYRKSIWSSSLIGVGLLLFLSNSQILRLSAGRAVPAWKTNNSY